MNQARGQKNTVAIECNLLKHDGSRIFCQTEEIKQNTQQSKPFAAYTAMVLFAFVKNFSPFFTVQLKRRSSLYSSHQKGARPEAELIKCDDMRTQQPSCFPFVYNVQKFRAGD